MFLGMMRGVTDRAAMVHARFHKEVEKKREAIAAAKAKPDFPSAVSP